MLNNFLSYKRSTFTIAINWYNCYQLLSIASYHITCTFANKCYCACNCHAIVVSCQRPVLYIHALTIHTLTMHTLTIQTFIELRSVYCGLLFLDGFKARVYSSYYIWHYKNVVLNDNLCLSGVTCFPKTTL